jgi:hypothetical protein
MTNTWNFNKKTLRYDSLSELVLIDHQGHNFVNYRLEVESFSPKDHLCVTSHWGPWNLDDSKTDVKGNILARRVKCSCKKEKSRNDKWVQKDFDIGINNATKQVEFPVTSLDHRLYPAVACFVFSDFDDHVFTPSCINSSVSMYAADSLSHCRLWVLHHSFNGHDSFWTIVIHAFVKQASSLFW